MTAARSHSSLRAGFSLTLLGLMLGACSSLPLSKAPVVRTLIVHNPQRHQVVLERVGGDRLQLDRERLHHLCLEADRYVVHAAGVATPAPLLAALADECEVSVGAPPEAPSGFAFIPGGPTLMGDVQGVGAEDERPVRRVAVAPFFAAIHETTNASYAAFLNEHRADADAWLDLGGPKCRIQPQASGGFATDAPRMPVVTVTLAGAMAYCQWLTRRSGAVHRLPTEEEWERLARGPRSSTYGYGDVYRAEAANQESGVLLEVGRHVPTPWGLHDVTGNAFEWTGSEYEPGLQVLKGGSYVLDGPYLRNSFRMWYRPRVKADDIGFRVIREVSP